MGNVEGTMTAKEYLGQYKQLNMVAQRHRMEYQIEMEKIDAIGSTLSNEPGMPHGNGISKKTEDKVVNLADKAREWKRAESDALKKRQEIYEFITGIEGIEGEVLYQRYIMLRKWEEICVLVHYSWKGVHIVHRRALKTAQNLLDETVH